MKPVLAVVAWAALFFVTAIPAGAASGPPQLSCFPGVGPCQETDQFGEIAFLGAPLPGCSTLTNWALIDTVGNGVQHMNVNASQDFWFTTTMVGATTIVQGSVVLDSNGNPISFTPDYSLPTFSGRLQQWFGEALNRQSATVSGTGNFQGTSSTGASVSLHFNNHINFTAAQRIVPNLSSLHFDVSCS